MFFLSVFLLFIIFYLVITGAIFLLVKLGLVSLVFEKLGITSDAAFGLRSGVIAVLPASF